MTTTTEKSSDRSRAPKVLGTSNAPFDEDDIRATSTLAGPPATERSREEFGEFCAKVFPVMGHYAFTYMQGDTASDVLFRIHRQWERYRHLPPDRLEALAFSMVKWARLDRKRAEHSLAGREFPLFSDGEFPPFVMEDHASYEAGYEKLVAEQTADRLLRVLSPRQREIMKRVILGLDTNEIAKDLDMNPDSVRRLLHRARERMSVELRKLRAEEGVQ